MARKTFGVVHTTVLAYLDDHPPATIAQIAAATGLNAKAIETTIYRYKHDFVRTRQGRQGGGWYNLISLKEF
jgi:DNA-binding IscR family transcriptional regulator